MIEILFFIFGIWILISGKVPSILVGGNRYVIEGSGARWIGLILLLPLPVGFLTGYALQSALGESGDFYWLVLDVFIFFLTAAWFLGVARRIRVPRTVPDGSNVFPEDQNVREIAYKTNGSLIYAILGIVGPVALVTGPLVFVRTGQALHLIDEHQVGENYKIRVTIARIVALLFFLLWLVLFSFLIFTALQGYNI